MLALSAWRNGDTAAARKWAEAAGSDPEAPQGVRARAEVINTLLADTSKTSESPMRPLVRLGFAIGLAGAAALVSGCSGSAFDPDKLDFSLFDTKQKLPGERKDVFPVECPA